jgi:hypothetical protein
MTHTENLSIPTPFPSAQEQIDVLHERSMLSLRATEALIYAMRHARTYDNFRALFFYMLDRLETSIPVQPVHTPGQGAPTGRP